MCVCVSSYSQVSRKQAALRSQDSELTRLKADLLEAQASESDAEARLQLLGDSMQLYKQKYQTCVSKIAELERTLRSREEDCSQSRAQVRKRPRELHLIQKQTKNESIHVTFYLFFL